MKLRILLAILVLFTSSFGYYLLIWPADFSINFSANTTAGTVEQTLKAWINGKSHIKLEGKDADDGLLMRLDSSDNRYQFNWRLETVGVHKCDVNILVNEEANSISNRLKVPIIETQIEKVSEAVVRDFYRALNEHLGKTKVTIEGEATMDSVFCVFLPVKTSQLGKAAGMMGTYNFITSFIIDNDLATNGMPLVVVRDWDMVNDSLEFDFCYPVEYKENLPNHHQLSYKWIPATKAIKATYNGNYITSDRAWYALLQYAVESGMKVAPKPIEVYFNNPNYDRNETKWRADIFMPVLNELN